MNLIQVLDGNLSYRARVLLSLDSAVVGEVDESEKEVGLSISFLEGVKDVELEEELVDKPRT